MYSLAVSSLHRWCRDGDSFAYDNWCFAGNNRSGWNGFFVSELPRHDFWHHIVTIASDVAVVATQQIGNFNVTAKVQIGIAAGNAKMKDEMTAMLRRFNANA